LSRAIFLALTFGVARAIVRDRYVSTDPVYTRAIIEFGRKFHVPQPVIARLVRLDNITVLDGIVRAEAHSEEADTKTVQKAAALAALRERITSHVTIQ
jgi:hypothetical protein